MVPSPPPPLSPCSCYCVGNLLPPSWYLWLPPALLAAALPPHLCSYKYTHPGQTLLRLLPLSLLLPLMFLSLPPHYTSAESTHRKELRGGEEECISSDGEEG
ncbi:hypothetical protein XENORESO_008348 [Xenotaenia resolanae]|uniref:Uncharacterized protein n=1 Tax=Xenotaenia resolanae TaxID=208358 RepID=A0ABV0WDG8_9TELE